MEHYKKKLEDMGLLRRQVHTFGHVDHLYQGQWPHVRLCPQNKLMEEKNTVLVQTNIGLEEELRKANAAKGQLETYKRQVRWWLAAVVVCEVQGLCNTCPVSDRWWNSRTGCLRSPKRPTRWSLSTSESKRKWTLCRRRKTYVDIALPGAQW